MNEMKRIDYMRKNKQNGSMYPARHPLRCPAGFTTTTTTAPRHERENP
jgi:hypothetical protein